MNNTHRTLALAAALVVVAGCASSAARFDAARLEEVRRGQTTFDDVVRRFGRPNFLSKNWDGTRTAAYAYGDGRSTAEMMLPAVGAVVGGDGSEDFASVIFYFDANGVLTGYKATQPAPGNAVAAPRPVTAERAPARTDLPAQPPAGKPAPAEPAAAGKSRSPWWLPSENTERRP